ncbi:MAG: phosphoribosylglycinamide formyltransferase [Planctomycetia bacterium]|nr:MAG: phosphoribosylglycinamide formyltransferase [Planctomycetia bacterium]
MPDADPIRTVVLISGGGSTLDNLAQRIADQRLRGVRIVGVICSRAGVGGIEVARRHGLPIELIPRAGFPDDDTFSDAVTAAVRRMGAELALMGGFLSFWRIPADFDGRVLNIHPALLPAFGGRGMYAARVHRAVLAAGASHSGCTVHVADNEYDHGPILAQRRVPVLPGDTPERLAQRIGEQERELYPLVVQAIADQGRSSLPIQAAALQRVLAQS